MNKILSLFDFGRVDGVSVLFERFGLMLLLSLVIVFIAALLIVTIRKRHFLEMVGFSCLFKQCFMWAILVAMVFVGFVLFFMIRHNGTYYFSWDYLDWTLYCGWVLIIPELAVLLICVVSYYLLDNSIKNSIKY